MKTLLRVRQRWLISRDLDEVLLIDAAGPGNWPRDVFLNTLRKRNVIGMVAEGPDNRVVGFMVYELRRAHLRLLKLAAHPDCRRRGVGRQMLDKLKSKSSAHRRSRLAADAREQNLAGQLFLKSQGFTAYAVSPGDTDHAGAPQDDHAAYEFEWHAATTPVAYEPPTAHSNRVAHLLDTSA